MSEISISYRYQQRRYPPRTWSIIERSTIERARSIVVTNIDHSMIISRTFKRLRKMIARDSSSNVRPISSANGFMAHVSISRLDSTVILIYGYECMYVCMGPVNVSLSWNMNIISSKTKPGQRRIISLAPRGLSTFTRWRYESIVAVLAQRSSFRLSGPKFNNVIPVSLSIYFESLYCFPWLC